MNTLARILQKNPHITQTTEITFEKSKKELMAVLSRKKLAFVKQLSSHVRVFRMRYRSQQHHVVGFLIIPKQFRGKLPCIIFNRGGSADFGKINTSTVFMLLSKIASWGYLVIASQYSGNDGGEGNDEFGGSDINDVLKLFPVLKYISFADTKRIGMFGASRGGMMTYLALAHAKWIRAAVIIAGPTNLLRGGKFRPEMQALYRRKFGASINEKKKRSILYWADKINKKVPILIMHGSADWRVDPRDSLDLSRKLLEQKVPHRFVLFEGSDHGLTEVRQESLQYTREWFDRFVRRREKLPNMKPHGG